MQINTDISPIVSPKSTFSNSFMSPRDNVLVNFTSKRLNLAPLDKLSYDNPKSRNDNINMKENLENSYQHNDTATNESYSVANGDYSSRMNFPINCSHFIPVPESSTDRVLHMDEEGGESRIENMHIIEYEEFVLEKHSTKNILSEREGQSSERTAMNQEIESARETKPKENENFTEENVEILPLVKNNSNTSQDQQVPEPFESKINKRKKFNFPSITIPEDPPQEQPTKNKMDKADFPLQDTKFALSLDGPALSRKESLKSENLENTRSTLLIHQNSKQEEYQASLLKELNEVKTINTEKEERLNKLRDEIEKKDEIIRRIDDISKENFHLKQDIVKCVQSQKETELENLRLKEKCENQRDFILKVEEKCVVLETANLKLDKELRKKDQDLKMLNDENKLMQEKKSHYKSIVFQKDETINELQRQLEEHEQNNSNNNELYVAAMEKSKIYKEKLSQMSKQIEDQKEILKSKDNAIENLLSRMDELTDSLSTKNSDITSLKEEIQLLRSELHTYKTEKAKISTKESIGNQIKEKDKIMRNLNKQLEEIDRRAFREENYNRKNTEMLSSAEKLRTQDLSSKPVFQSYDFNDRFRRNDDELPKTWGTLNLRDAYKLNDFDKDDESEDSSFKRSKKGDELKSKSQSEDTRDSQNIEELQKRLAYLKNKRLEFERKKQALSLGRDEIYKERDREESLSSTQNLSHSKALQNSNIQQFASPLASAKKKGSSVDMWTGDSQKFKEKENFIKVNNFLQDMDSQQKDSLFRSSSSHGNPSIEESTSNSRATSKNKAKRPPKIDNYQGNNNFNRTDGSLKTSLRYSSLSNTSSTSTIKNERNENSSSYAKSYKKSYDSNVSTKSNEGTRFHESPRKMLNFAKADKGSADRSSLKGRDIKELMHRGAMTPSSHLQASIMEKIMEHKSKK